MTLAIDHLRNAKKLYMMPVHVSRSGINRHYRILCADKDGGVRDVTRPLCEIAKCTFDATRGTYRTMQAYEHDDSLNLMKWLVQTYRAIDVFMI